MAGLEFFVEPNAEQWFDEKTDWLVMEWGGDYLLYAKIVIGFTDPPNDRGTRHFNVTVVIVVMPVVGFFRVWTSWSDTTTLPCTSLVPGAVHIKTDGLINVKPLLLSPILNIVVIIIVVTTCGGDDGGGGGRGCGGIGIYRRDGFVDDVRWRQRTKGRLVVSNYSL